MHTNKNKVLCSVCIATYKRAEHLDKLLESLIKQILPNDLEMELIVVDNDANKSAEPIARKYQEKKKYNIQYNTQPIKNISITRNKAIEKANGELIAFIDDDETASTRWLFYLYNTLKKYQADGVFGLVVPNFHKNTPEWLKCRKFYFNPMTATGTIANYTFTGNSIFKKTLIENNKEPFDPQYGLTGGEDVLFFEQLINKGASFVNSMEAKTYEFIPVNRTNTKYIFIRALKGGNSFARRKIELANKSKFFVRTTMFIKGIAYSSVSIIFVLIFYYNRTKRTKWIIKFASNIGRFLAAFNWHPKVYK